MSNTRFIIPWHEAAATEASQMRTDAGSIPERHLASLTVAESIAALRAADTFGADEANIIEGFDVASPIYGPVLGGRLVGGPGGIPVRDVGRAGTILVPEEVVAGRTTAAAVTPYGTSLPQADVSWTKVETGFARFGAYVDADESVLRDAAALRTAVEFLLGMDLARQLDSEAVNGDGTGDRWTGLLTATLPTAAKGSDSHAVAVLKAARAIRVAGWTAPIVPVLNPADAFDLVTELDGTTGLPTFIPEQFAALGVRLPLIVTGELAAGTILVGAWSSVGAVYMRRGVSIDASYTVNDDWLTGKAKVRVSARAAFVIAQPSAAYKITAS